MRALDTNIVVRLLVQDDPAQFAAAARLLEDPCHVGATVLLEAAWVLRSNFGVPRSRIGAAMQRLLDLPNIRIADAAGIGWALDRSSKGADLADMIHLLHAGGADRFATFDRRLARQAGPDSPIAIETLPA